MSDTPALSLRDVVFRYAGAGAHPRSAHEAAPIIDIPSFDMQRGEQVLLTGGSGSGKSTLLQLIAGLLDIQQGTILVNGTNIASLSGAKRDLHRGRSIGMIFQTFNLLHGFSACENVMAALMFSTVPASGHRATALSLLKTLGIERPDADPDRLSVGQQQRVAVARAIACTPVLILADEPTASLDPENAGGAMDLLQQTCRSIGAALLCVSHDPSMSARFERRVLLRELNRATPRAGAVLPGAIGASR